MRPLEDPPAPRWLHILARALVILFQIIAAALTLATLILIFLPE